MTNKILAHVYAPATASYYDMWLLLNVDVQTVAVMVGRAVHSLSNGMYSFDDTPALFDRDHNQFLSTTGVLYDTGIGNSANLVLI